MYKNIYDTPEEIEVSFSVADTSLYRLPLGRMFTTHEIWTGTGKTGTQLISGTDYIAGGESARAGEIKGESVYTGFQVTNAVYHSTTLYATIYWVGSLVNAEVKNGKGIETITATTYTIDDFGIDVYEVNNGNCTITLPDLARWQGREITVRAITDATTGISIEAAGSDVITRADLTEVTLTSDGDFWVFFAGSTRWELTDGVESGNNANGNWEKSFCGKLTQRDELSIPTTTAQPNFFGSTAGNVYVNAGGTSVTFPISFLSINKVQFFPFSNASSYLLSVAARSISITACNVIGAATASQTSYIAYEATGRWYT